MNRQQLVWKEHTMPLSVLCQLKPTAGQKALVYGATGAIGSAYVQFLKYYDVYVTAVCGGENSELVRSWGADKIIDYKTEDFTKDKEQYDFVFDAVGKSSFVKCKRLLKKNGVYAPSGGAENLFLVLITPLLGGKKVLFPKDNKGNLGFIKELLEKGSFRPVIDRKYPLDKIAEAFTYVAIWSKNRECYNYNGLSFCTTIKRLLRRSVQGSVILLSKAFVTTLSFGMSVYLVRLLNSQCTSND